jgi:hypothetical protein
MIFIDNKYTRIYYAIIEKARHREIPLCRTETHHIIPRCFYKTGTKSKVSPGWLDGYPNSSENLVKLTPREHFICHLLLVKIAPTNIAKAKMTFALTRFMHSPSHIGHITSRRYEQITKLKAEASSLMNKGRKRTSPITDETRAKLSAAAKRRKGFTPEGRARAIEANTGRKHSEETKQKLREARSNQVERQGDTMTQAAREKLSRAAKGRVFSTEHKEKIRLANKGKTRSYAVRQRIKERMTGHVKSEATLQKLRDKASKEPKPQVTCPYCSKTGGEPSMKRWHMDNCKNK